MRSGHYIIVKGEYKNTGMILTPPPLPQFHEAKHITAGENTEKNVQMSSLFTMVNEHNCT